MNRRAMIRMAGATLALAMENAAERAKAEPAITPLTTEFVMEAQVALEPAVKIGPSADGVRRYIRVFRIL